MAKREQKTDETVPAQDDAVALGLGNEYQEQVDAPIVGWGQDGMVGQFVKGRVLAFRKAGLGHLVDLSDAETGEVTTYGCPAILHRKLTGLVDRDVAIMCLGKTKETANGMAWDFRVFAKEHAA